MNLFIGTNKFAIEEFSTKNISIASLGIYTCYSGLSKYIYVKFYDLKT